MHGISVELWDCAYFFSILLLLLPRSLLLLFWRKAIILLGSAMKENRINTLNVCKMLVYLLVFFFVFASLGLTIPAAYPTASINADSKWEEAKTTPSRTFVQIELIRFSIRNAAFLNPFEAFLDWLSNAASARVRICAMHRRKHVWETETNRKTSKIKQHHRSYLT